MKKVFIAFLLIAFSTFRSFAQEYPEYKTSIGLQIHVGIDYGNLVGVSAKRFVSKHGVLEARFQYGNLTKLFGIEYQYHGKITPVPGLKWYAGIGPTFESSKTVYYDWNGINYGTSNSLNFTPTMGLDQKFKRLPLNISLGWRPSFLISSSFNVFNAAQFDLAFRYVIN
ncbi:MAG: hypothetical protein ACJ748_07960, partial [Flavisolibacter sp.]